ncbi:carbohydrate ABC transporter permease [Alicyclobacillus fodiniaquatilis]|uniref:Carbohydrate ABC transporter permease n=1 Tax=Alicyclobacillus fodiniaquatilis TaxID=1661150 RepID=A0ABW4JGD7_9BACL
MPFRIRAGQYGRFFVLICVAIVMFFPFLWLLISSLKPDDELFSSSFSLVPHHITFQHYIQAFQEEPWGRYFFNSVLTSVLSTIGQVIFAAMAGYAFARLRFPMKSVLFGFLLTGLMVPAEVTLVPVFLLVKHFPLVGGNNVLGAGGSGLVDTYGGLIIPNLFSVLGIFLMRQFFITLPKSIEEAARIDGCGEFKVFANVMLPLVRPALITVAIFAFTGMWDSFLWPLIVLNNSNMFTVQLGLASMSGDPSSGPSDWGGLLASSVIVTIPMFVVFFALQRYFLDGIAIGGVKG